MWGLSFSLARIATTSGAHPLGVAFWECSIAGMLLIGLIVYRRIALPITTSLLRLHLTTGLVGMVIPGAAFFYAAAHVPAGVLSITIGMVPILTYIASAFFGLEKFAMGRVFGVVLGTLAVVLLIAPQSSLPDPGQLPWAVLGFAAAACYAALGSPRADSASWGQSLDADLWNVCSSVACYDANPLCDRQLCALWLAFGHRRVVAAGTRCRQRGSIHALFLFG